MKADVNDTLRDGGPDAVRARHDRAKPHKPNGKETHSPRFRLVPFREIKISTVPAYLVKGIIPRCGLVVIWGPPKCGKSFWTLDLTMHIALGWSYRGRRVQQGP
jgi:AAA domain